MNLQRWTRVARLDSIPVREGRSVRLGERDLALFNLGTRALAVDNRCPHRGGPLSDGMLAGDTVVCPLHAWRVSLASGAVQQPSSSVCVTSYPARVEEGWILVALPDAAWP